MKRGRQLPDDPKTLSFVHEGPNDLGTGVWCQRTPTVTGATSAFAP